MLVPDLLKVKRFQDAEVVVLEHLPGKARLKGKMGALITFRYTGHTSTGLPRFASYIRVRDDEPPAFGEASD